MTRETFTWMTKSAGLKAIRLHYISWLLWHLITAVKDTYFWYINFWYINEYYIDLTVNKNKTFLHLPALLPTRYIEKKNLENWVKL